MFQISYVFKNSIQPINQMQNIIVESDFTIHKKNFSKVSSFLKMQSKEKVLFNHIEISITNNYKMQTIEILNKKNSMNSVKVDNTDKNQMLPAGQDKRNDKIKNRDINLEKENQNHQQLSQNLIKLFNSNEFKSQEQSNQIDQIKQQCNKVQAQIEDNHISLNSNIFKQDKQIKNEKFALNSKKNKFDCIQNIFKCLSLFSKTLNQQQSRSQNKIAQVLPIQNPTNISTIQVETNRNRQQIITLDDQQPMVEQKKPQQQPFYVYQLTSYIKMIQYDDTQENCNQIISGILEYNYAEFEQGDQQNQVSQIDHEYSESDIQHNITIQYRKWSIVIFNQLNQNLSQNFVQNRDMIFLELGKFNYFICKQFFSQDNMDLFIGYFQNNKGQLCDYIFKIYYFPDTSDISDEIQFIIKYGQIKDYQVVQNYHIQITDSIQILIMSKKTFLKLQSKSKKFQLLSFRYWNKKFFNYINDDKPFQFIELQQHSNKCKDCLPTIDCSQILNLRKFQIQQDTILDKLEEKGIFLCEYVNKGGEGLIFEGYRYNQQDYDDFILKILFDIDEEQIQEEIKIMKLFEMNINVIKFIDCFKIEDNNLKIHVFILEKCKYSLADELLIFQKNKSFTKSQLFKIIFDLLDGLIQLRIYSILHLDIKPANILLSQEGNYVYTDFGISSIKKDGQQIQIKGWSNYYASPELELLDPDIDFKSDVYSLGKTFQRVIEIYEQISKDVSIQSLKDDIINKKMIQHSKISRDDCLNIHESFLQTLIETNNEKEILDSYIKKIQTILELSSFDKNKDIPYILNLKLYYSLKALYLFGIKISYQNLVKIDTPFSINDSKAPLISIQQTNNLNIFQLNDLKYIIFLVYNISECYDITGKYYKSLQYLNINFQITKQIFKENHLYIAVSQNCIGSCYMSIGDYKMALEYLLQALQNVQKIFKEIHPIIATSLNNVGVCYLILGNYKDALKYLLESFQMKKQIFKKNCHKTMSNLGLCYGELGDSKKALEYQLESLQISKQIFIENHPEISNSLNNVGSCYQDLGDNKNALKYILESLQMAKQIFNGNHPDIAASLNNLGICYKDFGDYKKALEYLFKSFQMLKQIFNGNHESIAKILSNIGYCYKNLGDNKKALEYYLESLQMFKQIFNGNHPYIATSLNNIGLCYQNLCDYKNSLEYSYKSLQMAKQIFKENHPIIARSLNTFGNYYLFLGDYKKALEYLLESLQIYKQILNENHPDIAAYLNNVGSCYLHLGDYKKALGYLLESLLMRKQIFQENHPLISQSLNNVGSCYQNLGDYKKALEYLLESLQMTKQIFKENHLDIAQSLNNIGLCYMNLNDYKKALEYQLESHQIRKQIFNDNHLSIAISLNNISRCYQNFGDNKKSFQYQLESLQIFKQIFKENHPSIVITLNSVGQCYKNHGDSKMALEYLLESLQMSKQTFKENHPHLAIQLNNVGSYYFVLGDYNKALEYFLESLQMKKQIFKENHTEIQISLRNTCNCYQNIGDNKIAFEYLLESHQLFQ